MQYFRRSTFVLGMAVATVLVMGAPAAAHDPIFLTDDQTTPDTGPYLPDGAISWALYGTVADTGDIRSDDEDSDGREAAFDQQGAKAASRPRRNSKCGRKKKQ